jgi:hypothetical protein
MMYVDIRVRWKWAKSELVTLVKAEVIVLSTGGPKGDLAQLYYVATVLACSTRSN